MSALPKIYISVADYLAGERISQVKHEYFAGEVFAMVGASERHNLAAGNTLASLHSQLRKRSCTIYPSDMRVKVSATGLYTYPDVVVVCDTPHFEDKHRDTLLNPTLVVEVLSPSTESYDRGKKIPTLSHAGLSLRGASHCPERGACRALCASGWQSLGLERSR